MLHVKHLSFSYETTQVLKDISFSAKLGEYIAITGESGSGKSTLLKLLYGEFDLNKGSIYWNTEQVLGPAYNLVIGYDFMKYVAQEFDLMPFISVEENIGKYLSNFYPEEKQARIAELLEVVELTKFSKVKVKTLSGGQKQRVALARAMARQPEIILLDEPFSHIDNFKKQSLRRKLFRYLKEKNITCIVATHDKDDVLGYADTMIVLHDRKIVAHDTPEHLFRYPKTPLIASFFSEFNVIDDAIVYAYQLSITESSERSATVKYSYFKGNHYLIEAQLEDQLVLFRHSENLESGTSINLKIIKESD